MRQSHQSNSVFLLCLNCDRGEWRRVAPLPESGSAESSFRAPACAHCGGITERRYPVILPLRAEDRGLLKHLADWSHTKADDAAVKALHQEFRRAATERAGKGKPLPQWAAEWLQNNPQK